jgi:hypothetical protein
MSAVERAERYLRAGVLRPVQLAESDGTRHQVLEWDPAPVAYSGFMGCVTHSIVVTDRGTFEVGRYAAMNVPPSARSGNGSSTGRSKELRVIRTEVEPQYTSHLLENA